MTNQTPLNHKIRSIAAKTTKTALLSLLFALGANHNPVSAADDDYYVEFNLGQSLNGEDFLEANATDLPPGLAEIDFDTGFTSGFAIGRHLGDRWRIDAEYLYRSDELSFAEFSDGTLFEDGNYASVTLSANAYYDFPDLLKNSDNELRFYLGAGAAYIQEVDIDFERDGEELSYETDETGFQWMMGARWRFARRWALDLEYRALSASDIDLESPTGTVSIGYEPVSLGFSLSRSF